MADQQIALFEFETDQLDELMIFLKRTRDELREIKKVRVWPDSLRIFDVNEDYFEILGLGYENAGIARVLQAIGTNFKPETIHEPISRPFKEFKAGRRFPWAEDRIM